MAREGPRAHPFQNRFYKYLTSFLYIVKEAFKIQLPLINTVWADLFPASPAPGCASINRPVEVAGMPSDVSSRSGLQISAQAAENTAPWALSREEKILCPAAREGQQGLGRPECGRTKWDCLSRRGTPRR